MFISEAYGEIRKSTDLNKHIASTYVDAPAGIVQVDVESGLFLFAVQGPVVQSIVSLTSSLKGQLVKCFTTL